MGNHASLFRQARQALLDLIRAGAFPDNSLPSEAELAVTLGVSRTTLREALRLLTAEGAVSKSQGLGNFVHPEAITAKMRFDSIPDFINMLEDCGHAVRVDQSWVNSEPAGPSVGARLGLAAQDPVLKFIKVYLADGRPVIRTTGWVPRHQLRVDPPENVLERALLIFLRKYCRREIAHSLLWLEAFMADADLASLFGVRPGTPLIGWEELYYGPHDEKLCLTRIAFNPSPHRLCMLRKPS